jgi:hypothetical protein
MVSLRTAMAVWLSVAVLFGVLLGLAERSRSRMDDPDPAYQRTGALLPAGLLKAPPAIAGFPRPGHRLAVFFVRSASAQILFDDLALQSDLSALADVVVVAADGSRPNITHGVQAVVPDPDGTIVRAYGLRAPLDGGYPVGYALVDREGFIRHRTIDPHCVGFGHDWEIRALLRAS